MFEGKGFVEVAPFPPCGDGLKTLKRLHCGEFIAGGKFDVCALNDGTALENHCTSCLMKSSKLECNKCKMAHYCSAACQKNDTKLHELECLLAARLRPTGKTPMRAQRLLLRFMKCGLDAEINFDASSLERSISEYLMMASAIIKKYLPELETGIEELMYKSCQLRCSCFEMGEIGVGFSDSLKKINHSCEPNVLAEFAADSVSIFAIRDIQPDEQLTLSYIDDPKKDPNSLYKCYHFNCQCSYCRKK